MNQFGPRTPVVVGVGQASERLDAETYRRRSPVDLAADAAADALTDTGADPAAVAAAIDTVVGVRQFENSVPGARAPLGRSDNYPRSVAGRIAAGPARAVLETSGGQAPQHLVNEFAAVIAGGGSQVTVIFGSEAISTIEHFAHESERPDFTEHAEGSLEDRGYGLSGMMSRHLAAHGLTGAPSQYFNICDGLGLDPEDPRGLTVTGGLPFFGGPGNNYSMHAIAETVQRARSAPGSYGLVGANGGIMSKYSVGVYSTTPAAWTPDNSKDRQAEIDTWSAPEQARYADGPATIETYTVSRARDGARTGIVVGRLDADGSRFVAKGDDPELLNLLTAAKEPVGQPVYVRSFGPGNRVTTTRARMDELFPPE